MRDLIARPVRIRHPAPFPAAFHHLQVALPSASGVDAHAVVVDLAPSVDDALVDAAVRRHWWSADHGQLTVRRASARRILDEGVPLLRPTDLGWVDPAERSLPGFPLAADGLDDDRLWARACRTDASGTSEGWMPYTTAVARPGDARPGEALAHPPLLGGFGAGVDPAAARDAGWRSGVVDDALWCWWLGLARALPVDPHAEVRGLWSDADLRLTLRRLDRGARAPVTLAGVDDGVALTLGGGFGVGAEAQRAAIARALWQLVLARTLDDARGTLHGRGVPGVVPYCVDRRYAPDDVRARRRLLDPLAHVQLALDPSVRAAVRRRLDAPAPTPVSSSLAGPPSAPAPDPTWTIDLSPDGRVVRVLTPSALPLPLGAYRLDPASIAAAADRTGTPLTASAISQPPYPGW